MKNGNLGFLILSLFLISGLQLVNLFLVAVPDWIAIVVILLAAISLIIFIVKSFRKRK